MCRPSSSSRQQQRRVCEWKALYAIVPLGLSIVACAFVRMTSEETATTPELFLAKWTTDHNIPLGSSHVLLWTIAIASSLLDVVVCKSPSEEEHNHGLPPAGPSFSEVFPDGLKAQNQPSLVERYGDVFTVPSPLPGVVPVQIVINEPHLVKELCVRQANMYRDPSSFTTRGDAFARATREVVGAGVTGLKGRGVVVAQEGAAEGVPQEPAALGREGTARGGDRGGRRPVRRAGRGSRRGRGRSRGSPGDQGRRGRRTLLPLRSEARFRHR